MKLTDYVAQTAIYAGYVRRVQFEQKMRLA